LRQAEDRGELHLEGVVGDSLANATIVHHSVDAVLDHFSDLLERRPDLLQSRLEELLDEDVDEDQQAAAMDEVDEAFETGKPLKVSTKLKDFLQRYQQYLEPSFRDTMITAGVVTDNNNTWPVDFYICPPPVLPGAEAEAANPDSNTDMGIKLLDSDKRGQPDDSAIDNARPSDKQHPAQLQCASSYDDVASWLDSAHNDDTPAAHQADVISDYFCNPYSDRFCL